jgi:hypothetical protein
MKKLRVIHREDEADDSNEDQPQPTQPEEEDLTWTTAQWYEFFNLPERTKNETRNKTEDLKSSERQTQES